MFNRTLFAAKTLAVAVFSVAVAGCDTDMMLGNGQGKPANDQVQARLASQTDETPVANIGEANSSDVIALNQSATETQKWLTVKSDSFDRNGTFPSKLMSDNAAGPKIEWSGAPANTESFAVIVEDPDATDQRPFVHLIAFNIPGDQTQLNFKDLSNSRMSDRGIELGKNSRSEMDYFAPQPASGQAHHYHFQVFALDGKLPLPAGANKKEVLDAMHGHVIAKGEIVAVAESK
jgi:Raf kinase inhibitor-like YbhB/YbcL family protein